MQAEANNSRLHSLVGLACIGNALCALRSVDLPTGDCLPPAAAATAHHCTATASATSIQSDPTRAFNNARITTAQKYALAASHLATAWQDFEWGQWDGISVVWELGGIWVD